LRLSERCYKSRAIRAQPRTPAEPRASDFPALAVNPPFTPLGAQVRIRLVAGSIFQLWIYAHDAADDALAFTTGAPPGQPGSVGDGLWGCMSQVFPAVLRPPGCV
jgi:hypothetical protein